MSFKNISFIFSAVMIILCLTLYFQPTKVGQSINLDHYAHLDYQEEESHSLADFNKKITPYKLEEIIEDRLKQNSLKRQKTRVMEIGFGHGRVLMELKKLFPEVEFYGINKEKSLTFYRRESFVHTALKFKIMSQDEAEHELPYVVFKDLDFGNHIPYNDQRFDVVFSQNTVKHVRYAAELINETLRILKPGGTSIHSDIGDFVVYDKNMPLTLKDFGLEMRKLGHNIHTIETTESFRIEKTRHPEKLPLSPQVPIPHKIDNLSNESRKGGMNYLIRP